MSKPVQVVVVARGQPIAPFGVAADRCPIGTGTLADARDDTLRRLGFTPPTHKAADADQVTGPALVMADDLWVTRRALQGFISTATRQSEVVRLRLPPSRQLTLFLPLQDVDVDDDGATFACAFIPAGVTVSAAAAIDGGIALTIPYRELLPATPVPRFLLSQPTGTMTWPLTSSVVMRVRHWLHVLRASHLAPQVWLLERASQDLLRSVWRGLLGLRLSASAREAAWRRAFVFRGRRCLVHPSAIVEGSVIGDDVVIGPGAIVINSIIGDGSRIEQRTHVNQCTLGRRTFMSLNSSMQACVTFDDTDACANNLQACVIGTEAGLTSFARALDTRLHPDGRPGGPVTVMDDGVVRSAGELPCGACFGPRTYIGAGVTLAAGRAVPAGVRIIAGAADIVATVDDATPGTWVVGANGRLTRT